MGSRCSRRISAVIRLTSDFHLAHYLFCLVVAHSLSHHNCRHKNRTFPSQRICLGPLPTQLAPLHSSCHQRKPTLAGRFPLRAIRCNFSFASIKSLDSRPKMVTFCFQPSLARAPALPKAFCNRFQPRRTLHCIALLNTCSAFACSRLDRKIYWSSIIVFVGNEWKNC